MRNLQLAVTAISLLGASSVMASDWSIDSAHSTAGFTVKHMMVTNVHGSFGKVAGTVHVDDKDATKDTIDATIDVASITTNEPKRDTHLKSPDFFDADKNPTITFKSSKVEKSGKNKLKITGDLTMHGVTKPVVLAVETGDKGYKDPFQGAEHRGAVATAKINRKDFGLTWNKALEGGGFIVGEDVEIEINVELVPPAPAAKG
jgi:polyisoprenoid-binding protein YceI